MEAKSSKHHYVPEFVIKGFINSSYEVYIYDKQTDEIKSKPRPPKSVFWEKNRNTMTNGIESSSVIEDEFYKKLDDICAKVLNKFRVEEITKELLNDYNSDVFQFFIINLFWRIPYTDNAVKDLISRAEISPIELKNDLNFLKNERSGLYRHTLDEFGKSTPPQNNYSVKISEFESDTFVLGDNSILFESLPSKFTDLNYLDFMFPISTNRVYISTLNGNNHFNRRSGLEMNTLIIDQSEKYIVSGNKELLHTSVNYYREFKKYNLLADIKNKLFNN